MAPWDPLVLIRSGIEIYTNKDSGTFFYANRFADEQDSLLRISPKSREAKLLSLIRCGTLDISDSKEGELLSNEEGMLHKVVQN